MLLFLEEAAVEFVAIVATLTAAGLLLMALVGLALERRAARAVATSRTVEIRSAPVSDSGRRLSRSSFTPSHT